MNYQQIKKIAASIFIIWIFIMPLFVYSQNNFRISLEDCISAAVKHYPAIKEEPIISSISELEIKNLQLLWRPLINLNSRISYQSDVTELPISIPGINIISPGRNQYNANIELNQLVYNGGIIKTQAEIIETNSALDILQTDIEIWQYKERVRGLYFNLLLLNESKKILKSLKLSLKQKLEVIQSAVRNGSILASNEDELLAELLNIDQKITDSQINYNSGIRILNLLCKLKLNAECEFILPQIESSYPESNLRKELEVFEMQKFKLDKLNQLNKLSRKPNIIGFAKLGYGRPGLNMLSNNFEGYYMLGASLSWKLYDWGKSRNQTNIFNFQKNRINYKADKFNLNLKINIFKQEAKIESIQAQLKSDKENINLRNKIVMAASSQLDNGIINSSDFIQKKNAETQAILNLYIHKIQLLDANHSLRHLLGH